MHPVKPPADNIKRIGPKWDSSRLTEETRFVLGSKANKALGFGAMRGRLYTKHVDLFRYIGDDEDKQWLSKHGLMPPAGGRAYLLVKDDIEALIDTDEYRGQPGVNAKDMGDGFVVPEVMVAKMRKLMDSLCDKSSVPVDVKTTGGLESTTSSKPSSVGRPTSGLGASSLEDLELQTPFSPSQLNSISPLGVDSDRSTSQN